jgi:hypothetical protein
MTGLTKLSICFIKIMETDVTKTAGENVLSAFRSRLEFASVVIIGRKENSL